MRKSMVGLLFLGILAGGCGMMKSEAGDSFDKPKPAPELAKLAKFVGNWTGTAEMISPTAEEMKKMMPEGSKPIPSTLKSAEKWEWVDGGLTLRGEGWHERPGGEKENWAGVIVWDARSKTYRSWWRSDYGTIMEGRMSISDDGNMWKVSIKTLVGEKSSGSGTLTFANDRMMEWDWTEKSSMGKFKLKGTSTKQ